LRFEGIDTTQEYRERLFWLKTGNTAAGDVLTYGNRQIRSASLGQGGGGAGALGAAWLLIPQVMNKQGAPQAAPAAAPAVTLVNLPQMQRKSPRDQQVLPQLRKQPNPTHTTNNWLAPNAVNQSQPTAKFGPECGQKIE
jgi:hypothetical protein